MKSLTMKIIIVLILLIACKKKPAETPRYELDMPDDIFEDIEDDFDDLPEDTSDPSD